MAVTMKRLVEESDEVSDVTDVIGHYGKWQKIVFVFMFFMGFPAAWNNLVLTFMAPSDVDHWCARPSDCQNLTIGEWKNLTVPLVGSDDGGHPTYDQCHRYRYNGTCSRNGSENIVRGNTTVSCRRWEYDHSFYPSTILEKWNLVCDNSWMVSLSQSIYMAGILLGTMALGHSSDRFGRRPVLLTSYVLTILAGLLCAFSPSYILFTITRFFLGCGKTGLFDTCFVHLMESVGPKYRSVLGVAVEFGWATGYVILPGIVWLARDWFVIQLSITLPVILLGTMWWFLPESPRWLIAHGKTAEAEKVIEKIAKTNDLSISDLSGCVRKLIAKSNKEGTSKPAKHGTVFDLMRSPNIRWKALILSLNWFVVSFVFYGISLHTSSLGGNAFLNFFISGAVEFPGYIICIFIVKKLGRRLPLTASMVAAGVACVLTIPIPDKLHWLRITFAMMGKLSVTIAFAIIYIYTAEVYPTVVRNIGLSSGSFCSGVGSVLAPFVKELGEYTHPYVPMALFGGLAVVAGAFILRLPETKNVTLSDVVNQERCDYHSIERTS